MDWVPCRQEYLDSLLFLEGRGEALVVTRCVSGVYRCNDCLGGVLLCCKCTLAIHENLPLHNILSKFCMSVWTGQMFEHASLRGLGLTVQLGHPVYQKCPVPVYASSSVRVTFCGCSNAPHHCVQLLCWRWFPSTVLQPKSCATFEVLHQYQLLSLSSKISIHHFYNMLERLTDNTGLVPVPNKYKSFCQMVREWRHLKMLKRAGHGNDPSSVLGTASGELAVICPACPEPGVNLPEEWMNTPEEERFLYDGIYAIDANFCLKNHARSSVDPGLGTGWAYFRSFVCLSISPQISSLTGIGAVVCARHGLLRPNGIGDLQKGERFCNMDYIMFSSLQGTKLGRITISYDIFCQWITKLHCQLPSAHKPEGHAQFSLNWMPGVGRTDGEGIERDWSGINPAANSTKEMGSGCRHNTLDDIWSDLNYRKIMTLNKSQAQIHLELIEMERDSLYHGSVSLHNVSASAFVIMGLDIEDTQ
ncbi:hypothetical protein BS47DRAFT_1374483 [Hydnum rufescens UP504]|uniref:CxC2-like cysteine cluster KDZ transposase-associated domain-containing protein n=1 Tax=Hydnum rufescens UP504 TaxID=1448309 RepID=A0A9P6AC77_9AGAM|nr:hypothetical protein BS47DRAFT_1374483 [Hydnum rufescens UP504]